MNAQLIDTLTRTGTGPLFGLESEDLNITVLEWPNGHVIEPHVNSEVDVVTVVMAGEGVATIDGEQHELRPGLLVLFPKGAERSIQSRSDGFRYANIHKRRRKLMPV